MGFGKYYHGVRYKRVLRGHEKYSRTQRNSLFPFPTDAVNISIAFRPFWGHWLFLSLFSLPTDATQYSGLYLVVDRRNYPMIPHPLTLFSTLFSRKARTCSAEILGRSKYFNEIFATIPLPIGVVSEHPRCRENFSRLNNIVKGYNNQVRCASFCDCEMASCLYRLWSQNALLYLI